MSYGYMEELTNKARERYKDKLALCGIKDCLYKLPADEWKRNPEWPEISYPEWPEISYPQVCNYLVKSPRVYSLEAMENYQSLEAHNYYKWGWVYPVYHIRTSLGHFVLKADVRRSYRTTEEPHQPWVCLEKNGKVLAGHCTCMAGLGETCSHVAALLFKVEAAVRLGFTTKVCTELPCVWNDYHIDEVKQARIAEIELYDKVAKRRLTGDARSPLIEKSCLCALSNVDTNVVGLCAFTDHNERFVCKPPSPKPCLPRPLYNADVDTQSVQEEVINLAKSALTLSETEIKLVEEKTRTQSSSVAWHQQRAGRITASLAHDVLHTNVEKPAPSLIKKICASNDVPLSVPAVTWGNDHESSALFAYAEAIGAEFKSEKDIVVAKEVKMTQSSTHTDATVRTCGLFIKLDKQYVGASPDGLVRCLCCGTGVVEVKCPYRYRDVCLDDVVGTKECCLDKDYRLKKDHKYYNQMQFQMGVCDVVFGDFVYWTPNQVVVDRVVRDEFRKNEIFDRCTKVWSDAVLKELLTRHLEYAEPGTSKTSDETENVYCICRKAAHGEMIGCDKCDEWFHTECINMKRLPKSNKKWYCAQCKRDTFVKKLKK